VYIRACPFIVVRSVAVCGPDSIMARGTTIRISENEKNRLDEAAYQLCGTTEVPYGEVLSLLMENAPDVDV